MQTGETFNMGSFKDSGPRTVVSTQTATPIHRFAAKTGKFADGWLLRA